MGFSPVPAHGAVQAPHRLWRLPPFKQAIRAARFEDDRMAVGARPSADAASSEGAADFGSLRQATSPMYSRRLVISVPASEPWKAQVHGQKQCSLKYRSVSRKNVYSTEKKRCSHPVIAVSGGVWPACDSFYWQYDRIGRSAAMD
jgi:hypothetical protein